MIHFTCNFIGMLYKRASKVFEGATSTLYIVLGILLFFFSCVNLFLHAQDLEVDIAPAAPREPNYDEDVIDGAFYFRLMCWNCHAGRTRGGQAPDLFKAEWLYGWTDSGIYQTISEGRPGTEMQKFGDKLSHEAIDMIVGYLRTEQAKAAGVSLDEIKSDEEFTPYMGGDVKAGEAIFFSEGYACGKCHTVHGRGATGTGHEIGPDMTEVASTHSLQFIVESILNPRAYIAPEYEMITIVTIDGKEVTGRKKHLYDHRDREDTETVQILDESGKLWTTYFKKDIKVSSTPQAGVMPENFADILSVKQMHDLIAYLLTLK